MFKTTRGRIAIAAAFLILTVRAGAADLPTYDEVSTAYEQTIAGLLPVSVEWHFTEQELPSAIETDAVYAGLIKTTLARDDYPDSNKAILEAQDATYDRSLSDESRQARLKARRGRHFLWTDGTQVHYRTPEGRGDHSLDGTDLTSGQALLTHWLETRIFSLVPDRQPKLRAWLGYGIDGKTPYGIVGSTELGQFRARVRLPPLGRINTTWADHFRFSELDKWTSSDLSEGLQSSEVGQPIRGEETLLVRHASGGKPGTSVGRVSIWLAHRKGFIPMRIERSYSGGPLTLDPSSEFPSRLYETLEVEAIESIGGGYYPRKVTTTKFGPDPKWRAQNIGKDPTSLPRDPVQMVPVKTIEEELVRVQPGRVLDEQSRALAFPVGTRFQDQDTRQWYLEGTPKEEFDRQLVAELKANEEKATPHSAPAPSSTPLGPLLWINVGVIGALAGIYSYFRWKARP